MNYKYAVLLLILAWGPLNLHAAYTVKDGKIINKNELATMSVQEHYAAIMDAYQKKDWEEVIRQSKIIAKNFASSPFAPDAMFYMAVGQFYLKDYEAANNQFTFYLKKQATPKHFEEAIQYKFAIAEKYKAGAKKHVMGLESLPKWIPAREDAIAIYDEVITALPHHDLGAQALFGKAKLLFRDEDYKGSIESYQTLIRRFPKHSLAADSFLGISEVYLTQCKTQYPDPDFLDLAEINLRKFRQDFPGEERICSAEGMLLDMKEIYAQSLFETAQFFERTNKPHASIIYYSNVIAKYPETKIADLSKQRLNDLKKDQNAQKDITGCQSHQNQNNPSPSQPSQNSGDSASPNGNQQQMQPPYTTPYKQPPPPEDSSAEINPPFHPQPPKPGSSNMDGNPPFLPQPSQPNVEGKAEAPKDDAENGALSEASEGQCECDQIAEINRPEPNRPNPPIYQDEVRK